MEERSNEIASMALAEGLAQPECALFLFISKALRPPTYSAKANNAERRVETGEEAATLRSVVMLI